MTKTKGMNSFREWMNRMETFRFQDEWMTEMTGSHRSIVNFTPFNFRCCGTPLGI